MRKVMINLFVFCVLIVLLAVNVIGQDENETDDNIGFSLPDSPSESEIKTNAKQCLNELLNDKEKDDIGLQDAIFSSLAIGSKANLRGAIEDKKDSLNECWPAGNCKLRETSQVLLSGNGNSGEIREWLSGKNETVSGLNWYLQIDIPDRVESDCSIKYDSQDRAVVINKDSTITGNPGTCFDISGSGYWLQVKKGCQDKEFEISCDEGFITSILYQKSSGGIVFVGSAVSSSSGGGATTEKVTGKCFGSGNECDYEGSLWATLALHKSGIDVDPYIPYLAAFADDNTRYFPSAFLHIIAGGDDYYNEVVQSQSQEGYWQMTGTPYNRFFDTGLGLLSLDETNALEIDNAAAYLGNTQGTAGCWNNNNIRDTGMILWGLEGIGGIASPGGGTVTCGNAGYSCGSKPECLDAGGAVMNNYDCSAEGFGKICCDVFIEEESCSEKGGIICSASHECSGSEVSSSDKNCCLDGACLEIQEEISDCELGGDVCRSSCGDDEEETFEDCGDSGKVCCAEKKGSLMMWIIILIVLIIIVALLIVYRNKLRIWWHRKRGKFKSEPVKRTPPRTPLYSAASPRRPAARRAIGKDSEMEDTLRKLKEMAK